MGKIQNILSKEYYLAELTERNGNCLNNSLKEKCVGIAGCGGLGSNVAQILVRAGVEKLIIVDFDIVSLSNLNRQFYFAEDVGKLKTEALKQRLMTINPYLVVKTFNTKVIPDNFEHIFKKTDVIVEAFDLQEEKSMIINEFLKQPNKKYMVAASGLGGIASSNSIKTVSVSSNLYVCGDMVTGMEEGVLAPRVMLTASHQANMVLRILNGIYEP